MIAVSEGGKNAQREKRSDSKGRHSRGLIRWEEGANLLCDEIGSCVEGEVARFQKMDLRSYHIPLVGSRLCDLE